MKKNSINQQILEELREIRLLLARTDIKDEIPQDLIRLDMKKKYTARYLYEECKKLFPCWVWNESELDKITSDRSGDYTVYFKNVQEADEENKNMSADDIKAKGIKGITLPERLLMELEYFKKTGNHLDINNWTQCTGSRSGGDVPHCSWISGKFYVRWYDSAGRYDFMRARQVMKYENL